MSDEQESIDDRLKRAADGSNQASEDLEDLTVEAWNARNPVVRSPVTVVQVSGDRLTVEDSDGNRGDVPTVWVHIQS